MTLNAFDTNFYDGHIFPKLASKLKRNHLSSISHRVTIFVDKACIIAILQSKHSLRSYRNARNLCPLFRGLMFTRTIVSFRTLSCFQNSGFLTESIVLIQLPESIRHLRNLTTIFKAFKYLNINRNSIDIQQYSVEYR